jgi:hypothetical protein
MIIILFYSLIHYHNFHNQRKILDIFHLIIISIPFLCNIHHQIKQHINDRLELFMKTLDFEERQLFCIHQAQHKIRIWNLLQ